MRVNCENCNTNFNLDEGLVKSTGSKVRCSKCKHIFVVYPSQPEAPEVEVPVTDAAGERSQVFADAAEGMDTSDVSGQDEETEGDDLDLSDIEKMLESEDAPEVPEEDFPQEEVDTAVDDASLDLADIEKILDEEDGDDLLDEKADEDEDLIFDLDEELEIEVVEEQISPTTELDLGDLEKMFESDEEDELSMEDSLEPEAQDASLALDAEAAGMGEEMSLETDEAVVAAPEEAGESLGFDVGSEAAEDTPQMTDELSLDIDFSLEEETETDEIGSESLDLGIDAGSEDSEEEALALDGEIETPALETEDLMLESESLELEAEDEPVDSDLSEALEMALDAQEEQADPEDAEDISLEALDIESDEEELTDFGEDEGLEYPDDAVPDIPDEDEEDMLDDEGGMDLGDAEEAEEAYEAVEPVATGGVVKKLLWALAVLLVIVVLLGAFLFLNYKKIINVPFLDRIEIPFLSKQKAATVTDVGNLKITYNVDDYRFLETEKAGKLFLITGKIKNEYTTARSFIQMSGSLYTKGKTLADTATAYCGNVIADLELSQMTPAAIRTRLGNRNGENNSNVNIKPGEERSFMIVFFDLPESLDEFTVSVRGSEAGGA